MAAKGPLLDTTDYKKDMINTTIKLTDIHSAITTSGIGITKFCSFNNPYETESVRPLLQDYIE